MVFKNRATGSMLTTKRVANNNKNKDKGCDAVAREDEPKTDIGTKKLTTKRRRDYHFFNLLLVVISTPYLLLLL